MSRGRLVNGKRRGDWGPEVTLKTAKGNEFCSVCRCGIAAGEEIWHRAWVYTTSHRACGEPTTTTVKIVTCAPPPPPPCTCGMFCFACSVRELAAEGHRL